MYTTICEYQPHLCHQWSHEERRTTSTTQRHKDGKLGIMKKSFNFLCKTFGSFGKTSYLCTRKPKGATNFGAVVQLVRILACHARGRGFEPRPHRKRGESAMVLLISFRRPVPYIIIYPLTLIMRKSNKKKSSLGKDCSYQFFEVPGGFEPP